MLDRRQTVADLVLDHSACARVLQRHRIDFCCGGQISIEEAASKHGIETEALLSELARAIEGRQGAEESDPRALSTPRLIAHIVAKHHEYLRNTFPVVLALSEKVGRVHGDHNPKLRDLATAVDTLATTVLKHLDVEEQELFPALVAKQSEKAALAEGLGAMMDDHLAVAKLLADIRAASEDFTLPDWACNSYRTLFAELQHLESDIFTHVHLENHVLKRRFEDA